MGAEKNIKKGGKIFIEFLVVFLVVLKNNSQQKTKEI
jgi:hypothetical protein